MYLVATSLFLLVFFSAFTICLKTLNGETNPAVEQFIKQSMRLATILAVLLAMFLLDIDLASEILKIIVK